MPHRANQAGVSAAKAVISATLAGVIANAMADVDAAAGMRIANAGNVTATAAIIVKSRKHRVSKEHLRGTPQEMPSARPTPWLQHPPPVTVATVKNAVAADAAGVADATVTRRKQNLPELVKLLHTRNPLCGRHVTAKGKANPNVSAIQEHPTCRVRATKP